MIIKKNNPLQYFTFSTLNAFDDLCHGVFTRRNGFSSGDFKSLNACFSVGDSQTSVEKNRNEIARSMDCQRLAFSNQVHETGILVYKKNEGNRSSETDVPAPTGDAMITDIPGKFLAIQLADCQGILLYDPGKKVVANVHSGWRGSVKDILGACVESMKTEFGCRPATIHAGISPSLGPCCAEFKNFRQEIPKELWAYKNPAHYFDFWKISRDQLVRAGLLPKNIEISNICTKCNSHLFYSFRKKHRTGRFVSVIGLK